MNIQSRKMRYLPIVIVWFIALLICFSRYSGKKRTWVDMFSDNIVYTSEPSSLSLEQGASYTTIHFLSNLKLPAGNYHFQWNIDCDGINAIHFFTTNGVSVSPDTFDIHPGRDYYYVEFTLNNPCMFLGFNIDFKNGTYIKIYNFRMYSPIYNDYRMTIVLVALLFSILWMLHCRGIHPHPSVLFIAAAVIYASIPSFRDNISNVYDTSFHISRLWNLAEGLRSGQFPVRCGGYSYNGYGAITSVFYPDFFLYPFALMLLSGFSINYVMQCIFISINIISAITMYQCAKQIFSERWTSVTASVLFVLAIYRITDVYVRGALGEAIAFSFLPLLISGIWSVWFGNKNNWPLLTLGACAIFLSHMLTVFMCSILIGFLLIIYLPRLVREKRIGTLFLAGGMSALICLFQIIPMFDFIQNGITPMGLSKSVAANSVSPAQLFLWGNGDLPVDPFDLTLLGIPAEPGMILNIGVVIAIFFICSNKNLKKTDNHITLRFALWGTLTAYATTTLFPWDILSLLTFGLTDILQFAWRFLIFSTGFFSLAAAYGYRQLSKDGAKAAIFVLIFAVIVSLPTLSTITRFNDVYSYGETAEIINHSEYNIPGTDVSNVSDRSAHPSENMEITEFDKKGNTIRSTVEAAQPGQITFPLFGFQGYRVTVNNNEIPYYCSENNRLTIDLPSGHSEILISYIGKALWTVFDCISLLSVILFIVMVKKRHPFLQNSTEPIPFWIRDN